MCVFFENRTVIDKLRYKQQKCQHFQRPLRPLSWLFGDIFPLKFCVVFSWLKVSSFFCFVQTGQQVGGKGSLLCCLSFLWVISSCSLSRARSHVCVVYVGVGVCVCLCSLQLFLSNPSTLVGFFSFTFFFLNCFRSFLITSYLHTCILSYNLQKSTFVFLFSLLFFIYYPTLGYPRSVQIPSRNFLPHAFY